GVRVRRQPALAEAAHAVGAAAEEALGHRALAEDGPQPRARREHDRAGPDVAAQLGHDAQVVEGAAGELRPLVDADLAVPAKARLDRIVAQIRDQGLLEEAEPVARRVEAELL